jgi:hypothetical protein
MSSDKSVDQDFKKILSFREGEHYHKMDLHTHSPASECSSFTLPKKLDDVFPKKETSKSKWHNVCLIFMIFCMFLLIFTGCVDYHVELKCKSPEKVILIDFEDQDIGKTIFNQYQKKGVLFPSMPVVIKSRIQTQSGSNILINRAQNINTDPGPMPIVFTAPQKGIRLLVGLAKGAPPKTKVTIRAYDQQRGGKVVAQSEMNMSDPGPIPATTPMKITAKNADIFRVEIQCSQQNFEIIDNLQFCTPGPELKEDTESPKVKIIIPDEKPTFDPLQMNYPLKFKIKENQFLKNVTVTIKGEVTQTMFTICGGAISACCCQSFDEEISINIPVFNGINTVVVTAEDFAGNKSFDEWTFNPRPRPAGPTNSYLLLILTPKKFMDNLQPLVDHKNSNGMPTYMQYWEWIEQSHLFSSGRDVQEKIKLAIAHYQKIYGIKYVMLVGDVDQFPVRYTRIWDSVNWGHGFAPSDLYYADLYDENGNFDNWDADNDNYFGEMNTGDPQNWQDLNQDNVNLIPDVVVGRIPASNDGEVDTMVNKIINYESSSFGSSPSPIMLVTGDWGDPTPLADYIANTVGVYLSNIKHYHTIDWPNYPIIADRATLLNQDMNNGLSFVVYMGHGAGGIPGNANGNGGLWGGWYQYLNVSSLNNQFTRMPVILAAACDTAMFHFPHWPYEKKMGGNISHKVTYPLINRMLQSLQPCNHPIMIWIPWQNIFLLSVIVVE